jgi:hypothetical protein
MKGRRDVARQMLCCLALSVMVAFSPPAEAQTPTISLPPTLVLPNYDRIQLGKREGLEAGAFVARSGDAAAAWYNPAGLASSSKSAVDASSVAYEWVTLDVEGLGQTTGRSRFNSVPTLIAAVLGAPVIHSERWRLGFAMATPVAWQPGAIDDEFRFDYGGGTSERLAYASAVRFVSMQPTVGAGYAARPGLRFGFGLGGVYTCLTQNQSVSDRYVTPDSATTLHRTYTSDGSTAGARVTVGMQWDISSRWSLGALIASPSVRLWGSSLLTYDASVTGRSGVGDLYYRDDSARFEYRDPLRVTAGLAWHTQRAALEADLRYHGASGSYSLLASDARGRVTVVPAGAAPTSSDVTYRDTPFEARALWNAALGGHWMFTPAWIGHFGVFTDNSPVADPTTSILRKANLIGATLGATLQGEHLSGSLGLGYNGGESGTMKLSSLSTGLVAESKMRVRALSLVYALSYAF